MKEILGDAQAAGLGFAPERKVFNMILAVLTPYEIEAAACGLGPDFARQLFAVPDENSRHGTSIGA